MWKIPLVCLIECKTFLLTSEQIVLVVTFLCNYFPIMELRVPMQRASTKKTVDSSEYISTLSSPFQH